MYLIILFQKKLLAKKNQLKNRMKLKTAHQKKLISSFRKKKILIKSFKIGRRTIRDLVKEM